MNIDYLCEFIVLADTQNFQEAAEMLFISQSSLSRHIQALEEELGTKLFDRSTRKVTVNSFGLLLLPFAKTICQAKYEYTSTFQNALSMEHGNVRIGSIPMMAQYKITDILLRFQKENSNFALDIIEADSRQLVKLLRSNQCDFAFIREDDDQDNEFNNITFTRDYLVALVPYAHPLADNPFIFLEQLKTESLLLLAKDTTMYSLCVSECRKAGFDPQVVFTGHRAENIIDLVSKQMGIALLMKKPIIDLAKDKLAVVDIKPHITSKINIAYNKSAIKNPAAKTFLEMIKTISS